MESQGLSVGSSTLNFCTKMVSLDSTWFIFKRASIFTPCVSPLPEIYFRKFVAEGSETKALLFCIFNQKRDHWIVRDFCSIVLPILRFMLHPFSRYGGAKFKCWSLRFKFLHENGVNELYLIWVCLNWLLILRFAFHHFQRSESTKFRCWLSYFKF